MRDLGLMTAFIDSYEDITCLLPKKDKYEKKTFYLYNRFGQLLEKLKINFQSIEHSFVKFGLKYSTHLELNKEYFILDDEGQTLNLYTGSIVRTPEFEAKYYYNGPLGISYTKNSTIFRLWTPVARSVVLKVVKNGVEQKEELSYINNGLWVLELLGDYEGAKYYYEVKVFAKHVKVLDPYGISSTANGDANYIIDTNKLYKMKYDKPYFSGYYSDAIIYEASIRDLTYNCENNKGTFLGVLEKETDKYKEAIGLDYIASLGVTHLQLLPVNDFGGVNDIDKDERYNWGYNPEQYFVPCGWYASNPDDPYCRINELLRLIDEAHKRGIRINLDVVYNHVYKIEFFPFDLLVPGYFYRVDLYGILTNVSGCGNDIASEKRMCSRFILDNLKFWAKTFNVSGFRFDLMGLLDIDTMNSAHDALSKIDENIMLYGEGWNMPNTIPDAYRPHSFNHHKMPHYAFFNDKYRDTIKGSQWNNHPGFAFGGNANPKEIYKLIGGSCLQHYKFANPNQTINYVECHDNYTFFDYAVKKLKLKEENIIDPARLALQIIFISQGVPFIHAGQEFYRTKNGVENSYNASDSINAIDFKRRDQHLEDVLGLKELIKIRKKYPEFRLTNAHDIEKRMHYIEELSTKDCLCFVLEGLKYRLTVCVNTAKGSYNLVLRNSEMIFNGRRGCTVKENVYSIKDIGVYIFKEVVE